MKTVKKIQKIKDMKSEKIELVCELIIQMAKFDFRV